jgi:tRNA G10  N-methylase Trm11
LIRWRRAVQKPEGAVGNCIIFRADYSLGCSVDPAFLRKISRGNVISESISIRDCRELQEDRFDVIVADPPYGFNTEDEEASLAPLYRDFISRAMFALRNNGQLIVCLPDRSHTGRRLPVATRKDVVIHQVLVAADKAGKEVIRVATTLPDHGRLFTPPLYWESEKALRRAILQFRIRRKGD